MNHWSHWLQHPISTHSVKVTHICDLSANGHRWFKYYNVAWSELSHCVNQCKAILNWSHGKIFHKNINKHRTKNIAFCWLYTNGGNCCSWLYKRSKTIIQNHWIKVGDSIFNWPEWPFLHIRYNNWWLGITRNLGIVRRNISFAGARYSPLQNCKT